MRCCCGGGRGGCGCCCGDPGSGEPPGAEALDARDLDLVELERRLERDLQAVREQLGRGRATA